MTKIRIDDENTDLLVYHLVFENPDQFLSKLIIKYQVYDHPGMSMNHYLRRSG